MDRGRPVASCRTRRTRAAGLAARRTYRWRATRSRDARLVQGRVQLRRVVVQPATPDLVIGTPRRDDRPESRAVAEDAQVSELVDDDRLECLGRGEDETPREGKPAVA